VKREVRVRAGVEPVAYTKTSLQMSDDSVETADAVVMWCTGFADQKTRERYWRMGGHTQQHRWHSWTLVVQIKARLERLLPETFWDNLELRDEITRKS
jgi:hypothetical protein